MKRPDFGWFLLLSAACSSGASAPSGKSLSKEQLMDPLSCKQCHEKHYSEWASSMHAYASDDPLFLAMNRRGQREAGIGPFCLKCHAPMALRTGQTEDGLNLESLPQQLKGVTCYFCHSVDTVEGSHDAALTLSEDGVMRGQFSDPVDNPAHNSAYSSLLDRDRLESSALCGSCHDIVNDHGTHLERTFAEWQETVFSQPTIGTTCSQCHMDHSVNPEPAATGVPGVFSRTLHSHRFPAVDQALIDWPDADLLRQQLQTFLDSTIQSALCVRGLGSAAKLQVILDNVAAGHRWPSGAAQDRRAWIEVTAYAAGSVIYQSGAVPEGSPATELADPDFWLIRDCLLGTTGDPVHMFWEAADYESNLLPGQLTFDQADPRFYQTHVVQTYPRGSGGLGAYPDRVVMNVRFAPFALEVFDDLVASGDLVDTAQYTVAALRAKLAPLSIGSELEWTPDTGTVYLEGGLPVSCISTTNLNPQADKVPAVNHQRCSP